MSLFEDLLIINFCLVSYIICYNYLFYFVLFIASAINICSLVYIISRHYTKENKLVLYYLDNCYYSKQLIPTWVNLYHNYPDNITFESVECSKKTYEFFDKLNITSFPTLIFNNHTFKGDPTYDRIVSFIQEKIE